MDSKKTGVDKSKVKVLIEVFAVYIVLAGLFAVLLHFGPGMTGFSVAVENNDFKGSYKSSSYNSEDVLNATLLLSIIFLASLLISKFALSSGKKRRETAKMPVKKSSKEDIQKEKTRIAIKRKLKGKTKKFAKCYETALSAEDAIKRGDVSGAKKAYIKSRELYIGLDYFEKKEVYKELNLLYKKIKNASAKK
jgi:hypothetical protein